MDSLCGTFEEDNKWILEKQEKESKMNEQDWLDISNFKPEEVNDESSFKPLKGAYVCRVDRLERVTGDKEGNPYDFYSLNAEIIEVSEGDKGVGRYLKRTYRNDNEGIKKLLNDMFTAGIELDRSSQEAMDMSLGNAKDKIVNVRAWVWTPDKTRDGTPIPEDQREGKQQVKLVKEFKLGKGGKDKSESPKANEVPF